MPRRGAYKGSRNWNQHNDRYNGNQSQDFVEHDDRDRNSEIRKDSRRRVSFKPAGAGPGRGNFKGRITELAVRSRLEDDEEMSDFRHHDGKASTFRRRGSPIPKGGQGPRGNKKLIAGASGWFQVTVPHGEKYDKQFVIKALHGIVQPRAFIPYYFKTQALSISFYIDDIKIAEDLLNADRTISMPDGFRMIIKVRNSIPQVQIGDNLKQKMKTAMVKRYNASTKALDLTKFHSDDDLKDIFCALFRPTIMLAAIDVIAENIPDLEALNLDDNKIHLMDHLKCLARKLPHIKILHLANNKITSTLALDALRDIQLVDLVLRGNPLQNRVDESVYVSEIRKKFPKLIKLDGVDLPPQIGFDILHDANAPTPKASFLCDAAGADIVRQFLEQYFIIFDSDNRQPLLDAYHEQAMFSLTATYSNQQNLRLTAYLPHNRNVMRVRDLESRCRHLKNGRLPVVSFLSQLPATQHDPQSFAVDLTIFTPNLILLTVTGLFKEKSNDCLRSFQRTLVIVTSGTGFCIKNEIMHVSNVTISQLKTAFKPRANPTTPQPVPPPQSIAAAAPSATTISTPDDATKLQMIQMMSQHSNMNLEWSKKCLEETNWNFERAGYVFTELHKQHKIPPEAFLK